MSVMKEPNGRRYVQVEVEVPGTPEQVWEAIATGPGVSSWFVPTEMLEDGSVVSHFGPGMDVVATQTAWDPPRRFAAEAEMGPGAPKMATEWVVEAKSGDLCTVRVVHSLFASTDDWDDQLEGVERGWPDYFRILWLYLTHFRGLPCSAFQLMGMAPEPASEAWDKLTRPLGLEGAGLGDRSEALAEVPPLAGLVERVGEVGHPYQYMLRLDEPTPGIAHVVAHAMGGQVYPMLRFYLYGDRAAEAAARDEPLWQAWMTGLFPFPGQATISC